MDGQPLKPLSHGNILIVGAKPSNFDEEILTHPRVILWSSQQEHWTDKNLPSNVTAVFVTRWIGHTSFGKILAEARKRHITMFNPEGTGMIAKQVKELLDMTKPTSVVDAPMPTMKEDWAGLEPYKKKKKSNGGIPAKLTILLPHIEWDKSNTLNAKNLMQRLHEFHITSTEASIANFIGQQRKKLHPEVTAHRRNTRPSVKSVKISKGKADTGLDVAVQMLDDAIQSMKDMRAFLVATTSENTQLRQKLDRFRKMMEE